MPLIFTICGQRLSDDKQITISYHSPCSLDTHEHGHDKNKLTMQVTGWQPVVVVGHYDRQHIHTG